MTDKIKRGDGCVHVSVCWIADVVELGSMDNTDKVLHVCVGPQAMIPPNPHAAK